MKKYRPVIAAALALFFYTLPLIISIVEESIVNDRGALLLTKVNQP